MEFSFAVETKNPELIVDKEYSLFWWGNSISPDKIGKCRVQVLGNKVNCLATITSGRITHSSNNVVTARFDPSGFIPENFEYGIIYRNKVDTSRMFDNDVDKGKYVDGFFIKPFPKL